MMKQLAAVGIGIGVLVAMFAIIPLLGDSIDSSISYSDNSTWDPSNNSDITSGQSLWETGSGLILLVAVITLLSLVIFVLTRMGGGSV